jgi:hypothetical protein
MRRNNQLARTKTQGPRMDARGGCATKGDARRRRHTKRRRDNKPSNRGKREEMHQRTRGCGALIGRGCGGGRVERTRGGGVDTAVAKEKVKVMATESAVPPPSRDLMNAHCLGGGPGPRG